MNKRSSFIIVFVVVTLICIMLGFTAAPQLVEMKKINETKQVEEKSKEQIEENLTVLSSQDKLVKAEIAKHYDTSVDFRFEKNEEFEGSCYALKFSGIGCITSENETNNVTYKSDDGDEVSYDLETGNITMAYFHSRETVKNANSIDIVKAETIAYDYAAKNCDIKQYVLEQKEERDNGYMFSYCKQICGYRTNDRVKVLVGFDGSIVWVTVRFYAIDESEFNINKTWFEARINELEKPNCDTVIEDAWIERDEDKVYFCVKNKATSMENNSVRASVTRFELERRA